MPLAPAVADCLFRNILSVNFPILRGVSRNQAERVADRGHGNRSRVDAMRSWLCREAGPLLRNEPIAAVQGASISSHTGNSRIKGRSCQSRFRRGEPARDWRTSRGNEGKLGRCELDVSSRLPCRQSLVSGALGLQPFPGPPCMGGSS